MRPSTSGDNRRDSMPRQPAPVIHLYTVCWDEADMLGFFFRHYDPWIDRYVIYDDGSTDGSIDILRAHPKVELRQFERTDAASFVLSHTRMQEHAWKESREHADWVVITAIDEHLWVRGRAMRGYLQELRSDGVTCVPALGFDMNSETFPPDRGLLVNTVTHGRPRRFFNKLSIFNPVAIQETRFVEGRHSAQPAGHVVLPATDELMLWHYKHLGFERNAARHAAQAARLGTKDLANGWGHRYTWPRERLGWQWDEMRATSSDLAASSAHPATLCERPLWWRPTQRLGDLQDDRPVTISSGTAEPPRVSVVVKCYNHARYVRNCIQSVLNQNFQDFELVVTDDASTDDTAAVLRSFTDQRISLVELPTNLGISGAMNATIARARGEYIAILNSDDWALPDRLEAQVAFLDANPKVGALFGQPVFVDDRDEPTMGFNDFTVPLRFPDFSRVTWLRQFFFRGNCLCAPTAMIRREVFQRVGGYDARLTSLPDLDFWIRAVLEGFDLHVADRPVTAFRIRDGQCNASAPRMDTVLRSDFEFRQILRRFEAIDPAFLTDEPMDATWSPAARLARVASTVDGPAHRSFALQTLYDRAESPDDFALLRELAGSADIHGRIATWQLSARSDIASREVENLSCQVVTLSHQVETLSGEAEILSHQVEEQVRRADGEARQAEEARHRAEMLDRARTNAETALARFMASRSWRYTEGLRRALQTIRRGRSSSDRCT
jgi:glycosyltransferase involved in cell wall biosynthesis